MRSETIIDTAVTVAAELLGHPVELVAELSGGTHATTVLVRDGAAAAPEARGLQGAAAMASDPASGERRRDYVVRVFPVGDDAVQREITVLPRLARLGEAVPQLLGHRLQPEPSVIVTTRVAGSVPGGLLAPEAIAAPMAAMLARIHALAPEGFPAHTLPPAPGHSALAEAARRAWQRAEPAELDDLVVTHYDFWCGNALWQGEQLSGMIDWSSARLAPRGVDVAWSRQDLVLLGSTEAADRFLDGYRTATGAALTSILLWDLRAALKADGAVETWAPNYAGIGHPEITAEVLRARLDAWIALLLGRAAHV